MWYRVLYVGTIVFVCLHIVISLERNKCTSTQCKLVHEYIIDEINKKGSPCENIYSYICKEDQTAYRKLLLESGKDIINKPIQLHKSLLHYLNVTDEPSDDELKSLIIERKLFQQCMKLGEDQAGEGANLTKFTMNSLINKFTEMSKKENWQTIDKEMYSLGLSYSFFDISVVKNPEKPDSNIILIQPPYISSMLFGRIRDIMYGFTLREKNNTDEIDQIQKFTEFLAVIYADNNHDGVYGKSLNEIMSLQKWKEMYSSSYLGLSDLKMDYGKVVDVTATQINVSLGGKQITHVDKGLSVLKLYSAMSSSTPRYIIDNFITSPNLTYKDPENDSSAEIKWTEILNETFKNVNITVDDQEIILVKNKPFFMNLAKLLAVTPNKIITGYVLHKFQYKHLRYTDWNRVPSMEDSLNKLQFCNFETELYGASYKLLRSWEGDFKSTKRRREIISNVADVMKSKILQLSTLSQNRKNYLFSQIDGITKNLLNDKWNETIISNYYGDFDMTESYFINILKYRMMLKHKELRTLRVVSDSTAGLPVFSLVDSADLQGQFILNMYLEDIKYQNKTNKFYKLWLKTFFELPKEVQYGDCGAKLASYLYLLLNEHILDHGGISSMVSYFKIQHLTYPHEILSCFDPNYKEKIREDFFSDIFQSFFQHWYSINEIVQTFGVTVAYRAMEKDNFNDIVANEAPITQDQLFFLTYTKTQCIDLSAHVNRILSNSNEFKAAFQCFDLSDLNKKNKCYKTLFDIQI